MSSIIEQLNNYLLETEKLADDFLPLKATLEPIQKDFKEALDEFKSKASGSTELSDKTFYINRYVDLVKKAESVFDMRSKRLQQTVSMLSKLSLDNDTLNKVAENDVENVDKDINITPEQANAILQILNNKGK